MRLKEYPAIGEQVWREELPNGLRLTVAPKRGFRKNLFFLAVNYGGADRRFKLGSGWVDTPAGTAHFLEHRMFALEDGDAMTAFSKRGALANAFTSPDMTAYFVECSDMLRENLELLLRLVSTPCFRAEDVERERGIIAQEIRMTEDDPEDVMYYALSRALYSASPLREPVAGTRESIELITPETLRSAWGAFYTPSNMSLVAVGDLDPRFVRDTALKTLPEAAAPPVERAKELPESPEPVTMRVEHEMDVGAPIFLAGAKTATGLWGREGVKYELTANIALSILLGAASPLYGAMYGDGLINETFGYDFENAAGHSSLSFGGETQNPEIVCLRVMEEAARLASGGIDEGFFARRKKTAYGGAIRALNSFDNICYNVAAADFSGYDYFETAKILDSVTSEDARSFLALNILPERTAISIINTKGR